MESEEKKLMYWWSINGGDKVGRVTEGQQMEMKERGPINEGQRKSVY